MKDPRYPFALEPGTEIGGYVIDRVLGAGGFGITYRGYNDITHKQVAIKEFYIREISNREGATVVVDTDVESGTYEYALRKFQEEAQAVVTRLVHPYIIRGENFVRAHNTCYLVMEYIEGNNLDDWLAARKTPPTEVEIRPFFEKLFSAVDYVHQHNMMHRDLTPRNIMVRLNGDPVLIDFGAAGLGIDLGRSSKIVAQLRYAPPEQSDETASGIHGRYTDIFSLAGVLFRTVSGRSPMAPTSRLTRISQFRGEGRADPQAPVASLVADPSGYTQAFLAGIDRGLLLDERLRPQSIAAFRAALGWAAPGDEAADEPGDADAVTAILPVLPRPTAPLASPPVATTSLTDPVDRNATRVIGATPAPIAPVASPERVTLITNAIDPIPAPTLPAPVSSRRWPRALVAAALVVLVAGVGVLQFRDQIAARIADLSGPAVIAPFRFAARLEGATVHLTGYIANAETRAAIAEKLKASLPSATIDDRLALGRGTPARFTSSFETFVRHLPDMANGAFDLVGDAISIEATAATPAAFARLKTGFEGLVGSGPVELTLVPATVTPYAFALVTRGPPTAPQATLTGYLPDDAAKAKIASALKTALPGVRVDDRTDVARGAPFDLAEVVTYLAPRLTDLDHAALSLVDQGVRLDGTPRDPGVAARASAPIDPAVVPGHVPVTLSIAPVTVAPYVFKVAASEGVLTLTGYVPDAAARRLANGASLAHVRTVDRLEIANGAPDHLVDAIPFVISIAGLLETGSVTLTDRTIDIAGTIRRIADVTTLKVDLSAHRPQGFTIATARYGLRNDVPVQECDRVALPPDHQDRPDGVTGVALDGIQAAKAIAACRQAVDVFPNVRRFVTALGAALQRDGKVAEAAAQYRMAVEADDATAMALYGLMLRDGIGEAADPQRAAELFERARKLDNGTALYAIGQAYERGDTSHPRDLGEASRLYARAAERNSADADLRLGLLALGGAGRATSDPDLAFGYIEKAAELSLPAAMHRLAQMLQNGEAKGHPRDLASARSWYVRSADLGRTDSMLALANMALSGQGDGPDAVQARDWATRAAALGNTDAMLLLSQFDFEGIGAARDVAASIAWVQKAAAAARPDGYGRLGALFQGTWEPLYANRQPSDYAQAFAFDSKGAALNDPQSLYQLGTLYEQGLGRPVDDAKAEENYLRAGDLGSPRGYFQLAVMAERGRGRPVDMTRAAQFYRRAAALSFTPAMVRLGQLLQSGSGVEKDDTGALVEFTKALQRGDAQGFWYAAVLTDAGRGGPRNPDRVAGYLLEAYQRRETHALAAFAGDMAAFTVDTRIALQRLLADRGLLKPAAFDGNYDAAVRDAVAEAVR